MKNILGIIIFFIGFSLCVLLFELIMSWLVLLVIHLFTGINNISDILFANIRFLNVKVITILILNNVLFFISILFWYIAELFSDRVGGRNPSLLERLIKIIGFWIFTIPLLVKWLLGAFIYYIKYKLK